MIKCGGVGGGGLGHPAIRYIMCSESKVWVIEKSLNKIKDLIQKMKEVLGFFNRDTVVKACNI
jgi:hypothetical protein